MQKKYVVVTTTKHRGVFFGLLEVDEREKVELSEARHCLKSGPEGFLGLAAKGPTGASRVGPAVPTLVLYGVTSVSTCTDEARQKWTR